MTTYFLRIALAIGAAQICMGTNDPSNDNMGPNKQQSPSPFSTISNKSAILKAIEHHQNDQLQSIISANPPLDHLFTDLMGRRAILFNNQDAIAIMLKTYQNLSSQDPNQSQKYFRAEYWLQGGVAEEAGFLGKKNIIEWLIKHHPQNKNFWLEEALRGAARGCQENLADWILGFAEDMKQQNKESFLFTCTNAMATAVKNYSPRIAIQIGNRASPDFPINPKRAIVAALKLNDQESLAFFKQKFPKQFKQMAGRYQRKMNGSNEDNQPTLSQSNAF